ncbi:MAG: hypothetical protein JNK94_10670 [Hyphomonadaceae bacterium]|nr:hypothetical protein [Hyphomonadaceae bacterium]
MFWLLAALALLGVVVWLVGAREPVFAIARRGPHWFVALRMREPAFDLAPGVRINWASAADFAFVGAQESYWSHFYILSGGEAGQAPLRAEGAQDAFVARLDLMRPPVLALGLVRMLVALGVLSRPHGAVMVDAQALGYRADAMPSAGAIATLMAKPADYAPAMVNFLAYRGAAAYPDGRAASGRAAYMRYGRVAMRTVYRTGGRLLFYGRVAQIVRPAQAGPCTGQWHDIAAMRYNRPEGILSMEHAPDYRAVLKDRDAGLDRTVVIASHPLPGNGA